MFKTFIFKQHDNILKDRSIQNRMTLAQGTRFTV